MWMNMCSERKVCRNTSEGRPRWKEWEKERDDKAWDREREREWWYERDGKEGWRQKEEC